jgi:cyclopropane fatty-acyl-phospholipid synthase-like methyltransferase
MAAIPIISKLKLKVNEHILDIGCGDGKITVRLARCRGPPRRGHGHRQLL